jgi:hypothetical protein
MVQLQDNKHQGLPATPEAKTVKEGFFPRTIREKKTMMIL